MVGAGHAFSWSGPFGRTYIERCSCGWSGMTFADTRETSIGTKHDAHLAEVVSGGAATDESSTSGPETVPPST